MSWTKALNRAKALIEKKAGTNAPAPVDAGVPMGGRIGGLMTLKVGPFLGAYDSLLTTPEKLQPIVSISRLRTNLQGAVHRLYTARGDEGDGKEAFLQVYTNAGGEVCEVVYFQRLLRIIPLSVEEQSTFLGENEQGLGQLNFSVFRDHLVNILQEQHLNRVFGESAQVDYLRSIGGEVDFVAPIRGVENRVDDRMGENGLRQDVVFMPYSRLLTDGGEEQLLICTEILKEQNGVNKREIHVDFMIGLVLTQDDVLVQ